MRGDLDMQHKVYDYQYFHEVPGYTLYHAERNCLCRDKQGVRRVAHVFVLEPKCAFASLEFLDENGSYILYFILEFGLNGTVI